MIFFYLIVAGSLLWGMAFSSCEAWGLLAVVLTFLVATQQLSCPTTCGILVPTSPALEGGFLSTGPLGKSHN